MTDVVQALANLEAWLETMRGHGGYGGPVVHWWANCLSFTGAGLDWRYEGIITGYLTLWQRTGQQQWLEKACRAGDDLVRGQLPGGNYQNSCFELNPYTGGTPHEAAADLGLLRLALALRDAGDERWGRYADTVWRNLDAYYLGRLWDDDTQSFRDHPHTPSFVPNKACTLVEALFAWAELFGDDELLERYALPSLRAVLALQVRQTGRLHGAIPQNILRGKVVEAYFPYYIARCIPALVLAHNHTGDHRWLEAAGAALSFIARQVGDDGLLPQVLYRRGQNRYPQWIAPLGDILRAAELLAPYRISFTVDPVLNALLRGAQPSGGIDTARGFAAQVSQRFKAADQPDFRDRIPVAGWCDKAFRYLAGKIERDTPLKLSSIAETTINCQFHGRPATWLEDGEWMIVENNLQKKYAWRKGRTWVVNSAVESMWN